MIILLEVKNESGIKLGVERVEFVSELVDGEILVRDLYDREFKLHHLQRNVYTTDLFLDNEYNTPVYKFFTKK